MAAHAEASGASEYNHNACDCKSNSAPRHKDRSSAVGTGSFLIHFPQVEYQNVAFQQVQDIAAFHT